MGAPCGWPFAGRRARTRVCVCVCLRALSCGVLHALSVAPLPWVCLVCASWCWVAGAARGWGWGVMWVSVPVVLMVLW